jgi:hypothetical protein
MYVNFGFTNTQNVVCALISIFTGLCFGCARYWCLDVRRSFCIVRWSTAYAGKFIEQVHVSHKECEAHHGLIVSLVPFRMSASVFGTERQHHRRWCTKFNRWDCISFGNAAVGFRVFFSYYI